MNVSHEQNGHAPNYDDPPSFFDDDVEGDAPAPWDALLSPSTNEWFTTAPAARKWLLRDKRRPNAEGFLPLGKAVQLIAAGGVGKTMAIVQLAQAVATGQEWFGTFPVSSPGPVLMLLGEEDAEEVHRRMYNSAQLLKRAPEAGSIVAVPLAGVACAMLAHDTSGNPIETEFLRWVRSVAGTKPWKLIVIDPLSRFAGLDAEKDNAEGTRFVQAIESLSTAMGATSLVAHHTNKTGRGNGVEVGGEAGRGSSSLHDGFRWQASLGLQTVKLGSSEERERLGQVVTFAVTKSNYSRKGEPLLLRYSEHGGALVPLDAVDLELLGNARNNGEEKQAKVAQKDAARREHAQKIEAEKREKRDAGQERAEKKKAERRHAEDAALRACVAASDGITETTLFSEMSARLDGCSNPATQAAVARAVLAGWMRVNPKGPKNAKLHHLVGGVS